MTGAFLTRFWQCSLQSFLLIWIPQKGKKHPFFIPSGMNRSVEQETPHTFLLAVGKHPQKAGYIPMECRFGAIPYFLPSDANLRLANSASEPRFWQDQED